ALYRRLIDEYPFDFWVTDAADRLAELGASRSELQLELSAHDVTRTREALRNFNRGRLGPADALFEEVAQSNRRDPWPRIAGAYRAMRLDEVPRARQHLRELVQLAPHWTCLARELFSVALGSSIGSAFEPIARRGDECLQAIPPESAVQIDDQFLFADLRHRAEQFPKDPLAPLLRAPVCRRT